MLPASARTTAMTAPSSSPEPAVSAGRCSAADSIGSADGAFEFSDEGSGAWIGRETLRRVLSAYDGRSAWTPLLRGVFERCGADPHAIVSWVARATPRDLGALAPIVVEHASGNDEAAVDLLRIGAAHLDAIAARLVGLGAARLALVGGLAAHIESRLSASTQERLVAPRGDALDGALQIAHRAVQSVAA